MKENSPNSASFIRPDFEFAPLDDNDLEGVAGGADVSPGGGASQDGGSIDLPAPELP